MIQLSFLLRLIDIQLYAYTQGKGFTDSMLLPSKWHLLRNLNDIFYRNIKSNLKIHVEPQKTEEPK